MLNSLLNWLGYYTDAQHQSEYKQKYESAVVENEEKEEIWSNYYAQETELTKKLSQQINALFDGYGWLESRDLNNNLLMTSLIMMQGQDEVVLKPEFINDIADKHLETVVAIEADGSVKLTILTTEELDATEEDNDEYEPV